MIAKAHTIKRNLNKRKKLTISYVTIEVHLKTIINNGYRVKIIVGCVRNNPPEI